MSSSDKKWIKHVLIVGLLLLGVVHLTVLCMHWDEAKEEVVVEMNPPADDAFVILRKVELSTKQAFRFKKNQPLGSIEVFRVL